MKKITTIFMALLFVLVLSSGVHAGVKFSVDGFKIDANQQMSYKELIEVLTTDDTVTVAESGKTLFIDINRGSFTGTLPTAASGLKYTYTAINGNAATGQGRIFLAPQSTDTFVGCVNNTAVTTFATGDRLRSVDATGDSVTIVGASTVWYCTNRIGTWADAGQ